MIVQPTQLAALDWAAAAAGTLAKPWKVGTVVSGRVLEYLSETRLILQINGLTIEADPPSSGTLPRQFQARVLGGGPQPLLELLSHGGGKSPAVAAALRTRIPLQGGLQPLLADLHALAHAKGARALPEPVRVALARLEASITDHHDTLDPVVLRDTLRRSGVQLEHTLMQATGTPARTATGPVDYDIKAALQRLAQALERLPATPAPAARESQPANKATAYASLMPRSAPTSADTSPPLLRLSLQPQARVPPLPALDALSLAGHMLKHVQAALSRIEIMQLEAHPAMSPSACMVEVPIRGYDGFDVLQLRIEKDAAQAADTPEPHWTLGFTIDPPAVGAIEGNIRLRGKRVDVDLWAERGATVQALEEQTQVLSQLLEASGLQLLQLRVRQGSPMRHTGLGRSLLEASA